MLFILIVKNSKTAEAGGPPNLGLQEAMSDYNRQLVAAGVRVMAKGLYPSSSGMRVTFLKEGEKPIVTEGPFEDVKEMIAGFILIDVKSREEAVEWALKMPDPIGNGDGEIELRQVHE